MSARVFVAAGEPSGDALGAALGRALRERVDGLVLAGLAGPKMRDAGIEPVARVEDVVGFGIAEVALRVPRYLRLLDRLEAEVAARADLLVTIDAPSLLLRLGRRVRARGVPVVHWVAPQVWAWRPGRAERLGESASTVLCLLPFEPPLFAGRVRAVFVGHPAAAIAPAPSDRCPALAEPRTDSPTFVLGPGSRPGEVARLWPVLREVARHLRARWPAARFVVPRAAVSSGLSGLDAVYVDGMAQCAGADAAVIASGTATIELAALDVPMVVIYRVHPATAAIARRLLTIDAIALPNLVAGRRVVPEHVQDLDPARIADDAAALVGARGQVPRDVVDALAGPGAVDRAADEVARWLAASVARRA